MSVFFCLIFLLVGSQRSFSAFSKNDTSAARLLTEKGNGFLKRGMLDSAYTNFLAASSLWKKNEQWGDFALTLSEMASIHIKKVRWEQARILLEEAENIVRSHSLDVSDLFGRILNFKGHLLVGDEQYDDAIKVLKQSLELHAKVYRDEDHHFIPIYYTLALAYKGKGDYDNALAKALKAKNLQVQYYGENSFFLATIYTMLGVLHNNNTDIGKAIECYTTSLTIFKVNNLLESEGAALCNLSLVSALIDNGEYYKAIDHGKKTIEIYSRLNLPEHPNAASAYSRIGEIYTTIGDYERAKEYLTRALSIFSSRYPEKKSALAGIHYLLTNVYRNSNEGEKAYTHAIQSIQLFEQSYGTDHPQTGFMYELAAGVYADKADYGKALKYYGKAIAIRQKIAGRESFADIVSLHLSIADAYVAMTRFDSAFAHLKQAETLNEQSVVKNIPQRALLHQRFGEYYSARKQYPRALASYRSALATLVTKDDMRHPDNNVLRANEYKKETYAVLTRLADVYERLYRQHARISDLKNALVHYQSAIELVDEIRKQYSADGSKFILAEQSKALYASGCRTALTLYKHTKNPAYQEQAFLAADRSKANALLEQLFEKEAKHFAGIPDSLLQREDGLLASIAFHDIQIQKQREQGSASRETFRKIQSELFALKITHQQLVEYLEREYPKYYELKYADYTLTVEEIRNRMGKEDILIEYLSDGPTLYAFGLTGSQLVSVTLPNAGAVNTAVQQFVSSLKKVDREAYHANGAYLYAQLLKPFEKMRAGKLKLTVIPDGPLHYLPFEALPAGKYRTTKFTAVPYLIRSHEIGYSYSAAFTTQHSRFAQESSSSTTEHAVLSFAGFAPVFRDSIHNGDFLANRTFVEESGISDVRSITLDGKTFNELKYSEEEVLSIGNSFRSHTLPVKNFLHTSATETNFKFFSRNYDILHVATHGFVNEKNPKLSAILFSQPKEPTAEDDGILYLNEAFALNLKANLVVLSSCESGLGTLVQGEGMMALTRGLLYAGAKNIVYSLWKVSDRQTYLLMDEFYKQMLSGESYASSLREAKLKLIASEESAFPSKWAGFVLIGE